MRFVRPLVRLAILSLLVSGGAALWRRRAATAVDATVQPSWPPFEPATAAATAVTPVVAFTEPLLDSQMKWAAPVEGGCPDGYPVKANDNSGIFHIPGGRFYERTVPERCYATAADALADGYRQAKA